MNKPKNLGITVKEKSILETAYVISLKADEGYTLFGMPYMKIENGSRVFCQMMKPVRDNQRTVRNE